MAEENGHRLVAAGPIEPGHPFPRWFEDGNGLRLELVTDPDPRAPAIGEVEQPASPIQFPDNFPDEAFYFMAEARLEVGGEGGVGRARVIMAVEAAFGGDGFPHVDRGVVFSRLRVRIDDVTPGAKYVVMHPYGTTKPLDADERGRVFYTCDLGLAEGNLERIRKTGEIAPFLTWANGSPNGYIGDGVTEQTVSHGAFRNHVEIHGPGIGIGSVDMAGPNMVRKDRFTVQGRLAGTPPTAPPPLDASVPALSILSAEFRTGRSQYRVRGEINPVTIAGGSQSDRVDITINGEAIGSAFPDLTGAWSLTTTMVGPDAPVPTPLSRVRANTASNKVAERILVIRN